MKCGVVRASRISNLQPRERERKKKNLSSNSNPRESHCPCVMLMQLRNSFWTAFNCLSPTCILLIPKTVDLSFQYPNVTWPPRNKSIPTQRPSPQIKLVCTQKNKNKGSEDQAHGYIWLTPHFFFVCKAHRFFDFLSPRQAHQPHPAFAAICKYAYVP